VNTFLIVAFRYIRTTKNSFSSYFQKKILFYKNLEVYFRNSLSHRAVHAKKERERERERER